MDFAYALSFLLAALLSAGLIPGIVRYAHRHSLLDRPDGRKQHERAVPAMGGVAVFIAFAVTASFWLDGSSMRESLFLFPALLILFVTGMVDDLRDLSPGRKFLFQFIAAGIVCAGGLRIRSDYGLFGIGELDVVSSYIATMLFITAMTNAFNLIDGVDGLMGGIALIGSIGLGLLFLQAGDGFHAALAFALSGALAGFLRYNFHPAILFMGDTGSLLVGFLLAALGIRFFSLPLHELAYAGVSHGFTVVAGLLFLPVFDVVRVFIIRMLKGKSPFHGDRRHLHHVLVKNGLSASLVCLAEFGATVLFSVLSITWLQRFSTASALLLLFSLAVLLAEGLTIAYLVRSRRNLRSRADQFGKLRRKNRFAARLLNF